MLDRSEKVAYNQLLHNSVELLYLIIQITLYYSSLLIVKLDLSDIEFDRKEQESFIYFEKSMHANFVEDQMSEEFIVYFVHFSFRFVLHEAL